METEASGAAVIPMTGALATTDPSSVVEPWRMLADGTGMLVAWEPAPKGAVRWGETLAATSGLARQLATVVERAGSKLPTAGETLFRLELPAGQTVSNLIPAVGGGFRGMTRVAGSAKIANHARLVPVGGAAAGAGAVALGPLVGLVALSVGAEMLARKQQEEKLNAIKQVVERLENHELNELVAALDSAEHVLQDSSVALLDRLSVPQAVGLGPTAAKVKEIKALTSNWITKWEAAVDSFDGRRRVPFDDLEESLGRVAIGGFPAFGIQVQLAYRALALDCRTYMVAMTEATLDRPEETVEHFQAMIQRRLAENADQFERLQNLMWKLAETRLSVAMARVDQRNRPAELQWRLMRLARAVSKAPDAPPMLTPGQDMVVEVVRSPDGGVAVLAPRSEPAA